MVEEYQDRELDKTLDRGANGTSSMSGLNTRESNNKVELSMDSLNATTPGRNQVIHDSYTNLQMSEQDDMRSMHNPIT
jgi:hypothetical protein